MVTVAGVKIKSKAAKSRDPVFVDEKHTGTELEWDPVAALEYTDQQFDTLLIRSMNYYNYYYTTKTSKKYVTEWMKTCGEYTKEEVKAFDRASEKFLPMTACSLTMAHFRGHMPLKERHREFLRESVAKILQLNPVTTVSSTESDTVADPAKVTIQDRLAERTAELIGELEGHYDEAILGKASALKPYDFLTTNKVVQAQLSKYEQVYNKRKTELELAQSKTDKDLTEGYKHYKAADFKRLIGWIDNLLQAIEQYRGVKKATKKARVKKAPSKEKLVAKLKYAKDDKALKLVSINPVDIIGAGVLWVYNTKTRKLGKYVAAAYKQLGIKGTSIEGFDTDKSVCKTLRKPEEKLKEFTKSGKVQLRKFLEDIKATETKLNGRIGPDVVLLKVE